MHTMLAAPRLGEVILSSFYSAESCSGFLATRSENTDGNADLYALSSGSKDLHACVIST